MNTNEHKHYFNSILYYGFEAVEVFVCRLQPLDKDTDRTDEVKVKNSEIINYLTLKSLNLLTKSYLGYLVINYSVIAFL